MQCGSRFFYKAKSPKGISSRGGETSSNLKEALRKLGIKSTISRRVTIVTYEMEMNIIIHSLGGQITVYISSEQIRVVAEDLGPGIADVERASSQVIQRQMTMFGPWDLVPGWV